MAKWQFKKLGDVATLQRGFDLPTRDRTNGEVPLVSSSGISDTHNEIAVSGPGVVTGRSGSIGNVFFVEKDFWPLNTVLYVKDFHGNDARFIFYLLQQFDLSRFATGSGVPTLNRNFVHDELVGVPSHSEQRRLVGVLDEAFAGITTAKASAEKNLQNARALFESRLWNIFEASGGQVTLAELADEITDGDHMPPPKSTSGVPFITISNINKDTREIDFGDTFLVSEEYFSRLKENKRPRRGDVLYTVTGATLGIPVLVKKDVDFCFQRHIGLVRPKSSVDSRWLNYMLLSPQVFRQATVGSTGTAQKTVSLAVLRGIMVPKRSLSQQRATAHELDALSDHTRRLVSVYQRKLAALDELKKSLLHQAFSGNL